METFTKYAGEGPETMAELDAKIREVNELRAQLDQTNAKYHEMTNNL